MTTCPVHRAKAGTVKVVFRGNNPKGRYRKEMFECRICGGKYWRNVYTDLLSDIFSIPKRRVSK